MQAVPALVPLAVPRGLGESSNLLILSYLIFYAYLIFLRCHSKKKFITHVSSLSDVHLSDGTWVCSSFLVVETRSLELSILFSVWSFLRGFLILIFIIGRQFCI